MKGALPGESGGVAELPLPSTNKSDSLCLVSPLIPCVLRLRILGPWPVLHQGTLFPSMASKCRSCIIVNFSFLGQMRANPSTNLRERTIFRARPPSQRSFKEVQNYTCRNCPSGCDCSHWIQKEILSVCKRHKCTLIPLLAPLASGQV